ncbi:MAG: 4-alpha-glucanotransferase [Clostridia bacterium]|nr:4-alpha-glucanotransferase [Clostridia bacterium]
MERKSGVLMHISSLFGAFSIGSFGDEAKYFIDFLKEAGFSYWQVLPFCMADAYNSPYQSYSAFGGNPYFVDLNILFKKGLLTKEELEEARQKTPYTAEYERLWEERFPLLFKASKRVKNRTEIEAYIGKNQYLLQYCKFMALKEKNNHLPWNEWESEDYDEDVFFAWQMIQYEFFTQWQEIKTYANSRGIRIVGDIPIYVSYDSCDVWSNQNQYCLSEDGKPTLVAGVPPDYFSQDGQLWGNPLYDWEQMKQDGYQWWRDRVSHMATLFDAIRIDHFRGFESYWAVPADAKTAKEGSWKPGPRMDLIKAIQEAAGEAQIIAEDLGDITPEVHALVKESGFPGMRVFQFGFLSYGDSLHKPHHYPKNSIAYTGTHDNNTLLGYLWELPDDLRKNMLLYCGHTGDWGNGCQSMIRTVMASHADLAILPIQDLLGYGSDTRLNTPGKAEGNWQFRITKEQLDSIDKRYFRELNERYARI